MRKFLFSALLLVTGASVAHSENLNLKFGPTWSCKMISAELDQRYQACLVCERQGKDFDPDAREKCVDKVNPLSLRSKVEKAARGWAGLPDNETPDAATRLADQQARQREIDSETKQRATAEQERRRRESDVSGAGGSVSRNAEELAKLNGEMESMELNQKREAQRRSEQEQAALKSEMENMEARQKKEANRRKFDQQMKAADKLFDFDKPSPPKEPPKAERPSPPPDEFGPNVVVFALKNTWKYTVHLNFHSKTRNAIWPGNNKAYVLDDSQVHKVRLSCQPREKICYGAWSAGNRNTYWGVGPDGDQGCENCCAVCGATSISSHDLIYVPGRDGGGGGVASSNAISAADLLGAAIGIAGVVAGSSGGGGGGSYRAPSVPRGGVPRNRDSGVSGGR